MKEKQKEFIATDDENVVLVEYKDSATAFNGEKKAEITGKGRLNNRNYKFVICKAKRAGN